MSDTLVSVTEGPTALVVATAVGVQGPAGVSSFLTVSGTTYLLSELDRSKIIRFTSASNVTVTVPAGLSQTFDVMAVQMGAGRVIFSPAAGVTINSALSSTRTAYQYAVATLLPLGLNSYLLSGEVTA